MGCRCCIQLESPQSILDDDNRDVFEEIIDDTEYEYEWKRASLWSRFRNRGIPSCDIDYWIQCMRDRYSVIMCTYNVKINAWLEYYTKVGTDGPDMSDASFHTVTVNEFEDMPDNPATDTRYLSTRNTNTVDGNTHNDLESATTRDYIDAVPNPFEDFAREFEKLFWIGV